MTILLVKILTNHNLEYRIYFILFSNMKRGRDRFLANNCKKRWFQILEKVGQILNIRREINFDLPLLQVLSKFQSISR